MAVLSNTGIRGGASGVVAGPAEPYTVKRSARFNSGDSAYLNWTPTAAGDLRKWTWSGWVKRNNLTNYENLFSINNGGSFFIRFQDDKLHFYDQTKNKLTSSLYRDVSAWYHIVIAIDYDNATAADRVKGYINGEQLTWGGVNDTFTQNTDSKFNAALAHSIGRDQGGADSYANIYLSDVHFIDGSAKAATDFAETDSTTGQWKPKKYSGSYGTNGFHLPMDPANGGTGWSRDLVSVSGLIEPANQNEKAFDGNTATYCRVNGSSKMVWTPSTPVAFTSEFGGWFGGDTASGQSSTFTCVHAGGTLDFSSSVSSVHAYLSLSGLGVTSPITSISVESTNNNPRIAAITRNSKILVDHSAIGYDSSGNENHWHGNNIFGHEATVGNANFKTVTYDGLGTGNAKTITLGFKPDLVWTKSTSHGDSHSLCDSVRGVSKSLISSQAVAETSTAGSFVTAFNSDGYTLGNDPDVNGSSTSYVAWCWKAGGAASSNSDGGITSQVSANTDAGFSIVKWTGNRSNTTVGHGLGEVVKFMIVKNRDTSGGWMTWHTGINDGSSQFIRLEDDGNPGTAASVWNSTIPTSSVFSLGADSESNGDGDEMIAYCWAPIAGYSSFGKYIGNANATGPIIECGFKPAFVLIKSITGSDNNWMMVDSTRGPTTGDIDELLFASTDGSQDTGTNRLKFTANGFQVIDTSGGFNGSGETFIYAAFAGTPGGDLDLLADTPGAPYDNSLNGGGNYATLNPLDSATTLSNGNLTITGSGSAFKATRSTIGMKTGKWYFEGKHIAISSATSSGFGIWDDTKSTGELNSGGGSYGNNYLVVYDYSGNLKRVLGGTATTIEAGSLANGDVLGFALDLDNNTLKVHKNGVYLNSGNSIYDTWPGDRTYFFGGYEYNTGNTLEFNFGQREFLYSPPAGGYKSLNTYNLADPTITKGNTGFDTKLWTGNDGTTTISGMEFSPDLMWIKNRSNAYHHAVYDTIRGNTAMLSPSENVDEETNYGDVTSESAGFEIDGAESRVNSNGHTFVGYAWDAGTANVTKNAGDLNSSAYNQDDTWSSRCVSGNGSWWSASFQPVQAFDGSPTVGGYCQTAASGNTITFTPTSGISYTTVEVMTASTNDTVSINGGTAVAITTADTWQTFAEVSGTLTSIVIAGSGTPSLRGIRINGKVLVDSGTSPNNVPSIATTYRVNPNTGFSIVNYTVGSNTTQTVAHGLNAKINFMMVKERDQDNHWQVYHSSLANTGVLYLNLTNAHTTNNAWNDTDPTSTAFTIVSGGSSNFYDGKEHIAYCWSEVSGYSKFGSWTNGSGSGLSFVYCGFKPRFLIAKCTSHTGDWVMYDTERGPLNQDADNNTLVANVSNAEDGHYNANQASVDILSNGFKVRHNNSSPLGDYSRTYVFAAFAESPFKYANAR